MEIEGLSGRTALGVGTIAFGAAMGFSTGEGRQRRRKYSSPPRRLKRQRVRAAEDGCRMQRIERTYRNDLVRRGVLLSVQHHAMMLAVTAAAGGQAGVRVLRERKQRRNHRKREGRKQQDGEQTPHGTGRFQCMPGTRGRGDYVFCVAEMW